MSKAINFEQIEQTEEFKELKRQKYKFIFPVPILFFLYYLTFPILSAYAKPLMTKLVIGNLTFGYLFGLSYFIVIWTLAFVYVVKARKYDRMIDEIVQKYGPKTKEKGA
ncbi:DUF485 domain-containing protein [Pseudogracilibacillus sp. SE30717A]|uniref:DUF485 domain-containing protein n=1 Tax=Pseudogracilibacillus sp. SE30717A TaxID=3098293 RepID=UPI00300E0C0F